ncbi:MAG: 4Fe-4S double cluster binding domain-containing protein [Candidatus Hodarchaeota archaeon]
MSVIHIRELLLQQFNASFVGFAKMQDLLPEEYVEQPYGISIGVRLSDSIVDSLHSGPNQLYAYHYHAVNKYLNDLALHVMNYLQKRKYQALPIPASMTVDWKSHMAHLSHKMVATQAGLGWIGKNTLLVTKKFGPRVRLVTVLTDAPLRTGRPVNESQCGKCEECVKACPVGAILGNNWTPGQKRATLLDVDKCSDFIDMHKADLGAPVCGICMQACPMGAR